MRIFPKLLSTKLFISQDCAVMQKSAKKKEGAVPSFFFLILDLFP